MPKCKSVRFNLMDWSLACITPPPVAPYAVSRRGSLLDMQCKGHAVGLTSALVLMRA